MNDERRVTRRQQEPTKSFAKLRLLRQVFICVFNDSQVASGVQRSADQLIRFLSVQRGPDLTVLAGSLSISRLAESAPTAPTGASP